MFSFFSISSVCSITCVHSLHQNKCYFQLRYSSKSVDFKTGKFTFFILIFDVVLLFSSLILSSLSSYASTLRINLSSSNPVTSTLMLLVAISVFPKNPCRSHLNCVVVFPVGFSSFCLFLCEVFLVFFLFMSLFQSSILCVSFDSLNFIFSFSKLTSCYHVEVFFVE